MSDKVLKVALFDGNNASLAPYAAFEVRVQDGLSAGLVKRIVHELGGKKFKAALDEALIKLLPAKPK